MVLGRVIGNVWATKKEESMSGYKLMICEIIRAKGDQTGEEIVAIDMIGAGIGDTVLISKGSSARVMSDKNINAPADAVIVGIVDEVEA